MAPVAAPLYRHAGGAMLRAATLQLHTAPSTWPQLSDPRSCRTWFTGTVLFATPTSLRDSRLGLLGWRKLAIFQAVSARSACHPRTFRC